MTAYILNVDIGKIVVIASSISELDVKVRDAGILYYEIDSVAEYFIP